MVLINPMQLHNALVSYQTAYLKAHYPVEFMASLLTSEIGNTDKIAEYIQQVQPYGN